MRDHVAFQGIHFVYNTSHDPVYYKHNHDDYMKYLKDGLGPLTANGLELVGFLKTHISKDKAKYPDIQLVFKREGFLPGRTLITINNFLYYLTLFHF